MENIVKVVHMPQPQKYFQIITNGQTGKISLQENRLEIKIISKQNVKKGSYTFDALPQILKVFQNIEEMFHHLEQIKNTDDLQVVPGGLEVGFSISSKIKKKVLLALQNGVLTNQEKIQQEILELKSQLKKVMEERDIFQKKAFQKQKSEEINQKLLKQLILKDEEQQKNMVQIQKYKFKLNESKNENEKLRINQQILERQLNKLKQQNNKIEISLKQSKQNIKLTSQKEANNKIQKQSQIIKSLTQSQLQKCIIQLKDTTIDLRQVQKLNCLGCSDFFTVKIRKIFSIFLG